MIINPAQQVHGEEEIQAAYEVLKSGHWAGGKKCIEFAKKLAEYVGVKYCVLVNSGSSANLAALMALTTQRIPEDRRIKRGDEIITTALCFPTTVSPIYYAGCVPVFVDVDKYWNIDPVEVRKMITPKTKAIMVAHNLGNPFDVDVIKKICKEHNLYLIEDNADSLSSEYKGKKTGSFGDVSTTSFYPAHHISTGEGGAVFTDDPLIFRGIQSMVNWGRDCWCPPAKDNTCGKRYSQQFGTLPFGYDHKNVFVEFGFNLKMTDIQAAIGIEQLKRIDRFGIMRRDNNSALVVIFRNYNKWFDLPLCLANSNPSWFGYVVKLKKDAPFTVRGFTKHLEENDIRSRAFFCGNITRQPVIHDKDVKYRKGKLTRTDDIMKNAFWIGCHPGIGEKELEYMKKVITKFLDQY